MLIFDKIKIQNKKGVFNMAFNLKEVQFVKYKDKVFPLNGADLNTVLEMLNIPKTAKVEVVANFVIIS